MATPRLGLVVEDKPTELSCYLQFGNFLNNRQIAKVAGYLNILAIPL